MTTPLLSVVIPTFNRADAVSMLVRTVLDDGDERLEVIVVDDGSTDDTQLALASISDDRLKLIVFGENRGVGAARNAGAWSAQGTHLLFADSDDEPLEGWFETWIDAIEQNDPVLACGTTMVDTDGRIRRSPPRPRGSLYSHVTASFLVGSFVVRSEAFRAVGGYDERFRFSENTHLGLRLCDLIRERGEQSHIVQRDVIRTRRERGRDDRHLDGRLESALLMIEDQGDRLSLHPRVLAKYHAIAGVSALRLGQAALGRAQLRAALRRDPSLKAVGRLIGAWLPARLRPWRPTAR